MLIFYGENIRLHWLEQDRVLVKTCTGYVPSAVLRQAYEAGLECLLRNRATKAFADNRGLFPACGEDLEWIERDWLPRMAQAGWKYWAVLMPTTPLGAMSVRRMMAIYRELDIRFETFTSDEDALAWLRAQPDESVTQPRSVAPSLSA